MYLTRCFVLAAFLACGKAQAVTYPLCATTCIENAGASGCLYGDFTCYCSPPASDEGLSCIQRVCSASDTQQWFQWAREICAPYGGYVTSGGQTSIASSEASSPTAVATSVAGGGGGASSFLTVTQSRSAAASQVFTGVGDPTASATPTAAQSSSKSVNPGIIAGPVVGGVVFVALAAILALYLNRKRRNPATQPEASTGHGAPQVTTAASNGSDSEAAGDGATSGKEKINSVVDSAPVSSGKTPEVVKHEVENTEANPLSF